MLRVSADLFLAIWLDLNASTHWAMHVQYALELTSLKCLKRHKWISNEHIYSLYLTNLLKFIVIYIHTYFVIISLDFRLLLTNVVKELFNLSYISYVFLSILNLFLYSTICLEFAVVWYYYFLSFFDISREVQIDGKLKANN